MKKSCIDRHDLPVAYSIAGASSHETKLVEATIEQRFTRAKPKRMIGDRAYDSDPLDQRLRQNHHIGLHAPQIQSSPQEHPGRPRTAPLLPPIENERLFAWFHNFR